MELFYTFININVAKITKLVKLIKKFQEKRTPQFQSIFLPLAVAALLYTATAPAVLFAGV